MKTEPNADLRQMASVMWQTYVALKDEGFSEKQALRILSEILMSAGNMNTKGDNL